MAADGKILCCGYCSREIKLGGSSLKFLLVEAGGAQVTPIHLCEPCARSIPKRATDPVLIPADYAGARPWQIISGGAVRQIKRNVDNFQLGEP